NLGDVSHEIVLSAADAVLEYLKDEDMKDFDKKKEIDDLLGVTLNPKQFNELVNLGKKITDYDTQNDDEDMDTGAGAAEGDAELDERQGVAVVFDDEEDDGEAALVNEVRDESSDDEAVFDKDEQDLAGLEEQATAGGAGEDRDHEQAGLADGEEMVIDSGLTE
ncbi:hypothetical protein PC116_g34615, partial [Phytophthora cactorum]